MIHVALIEPEIPWNTGNIGRTCLAAGAQLHLVRPLGFSLSESAVRRSGLDYWQHVNPVIHDSYREFLKALPALGTPLALSTHGEKSLYEAEIPDDVVLVFGREKSGLPAEVMEVLRPNLVRIPMLSPHVRSLNVSTSVGITLYEVLRRRLPVGQIR